MPQPFGFKNVDEYLGHLDALRKDFDWTHFMLGVERNRPQWEESFAKRPTEQDHRAQRMLKDVEKFGGGVDGMCRANAEKCLTCESRGGQQKYECAMLALKTLAPDKMKDEDFDSTKIKAYVDMLNEMPREKLHEIMSAGMNFLDITEGQLLKGLNQVYAGCMKNGCPAPVRLEKLEDIYKFMYGTCSDCPVRLARMFEALQIATGDTGKLEDYAKLLYDQWDALPDEPKMEDLESLW